MTFGKPTFGKPLKSYAYDPVGPAKHSEWGDARQLRAARYRTAAENLLREVGPDGLREHLYTGGHTDLEIEVIEGLCRERDIPISPIDADLWRERRRREQDPVKKPRKTTFNFRKAENNEHRTPRRSNPTVARPVLSRVGRNDAARTYGAYQELFEQGFRRRSEVERAVHQEAREGYGIFYPGHPALRGNGA